MRASRVLFVVSTLLAAISTGNADLPCVICLTVETAVKGYLENYRHNPAVDPSLYYPSIKTRVGEVGGATDLAISFTNFEVIGIPEFILDSTKFSLIDGSSAPGTLNITIVFPELKITGENYKIQGIVADTLPLHADGPFEITFTKVTLVGNGLLDVGELRVSEVLAEVTADQLQMEMVNVFGDLSDEFNEMMNDIGLEILGQLNSGINNIVGNFLEKKLNKILSGIKPDEKVEITKNLIENEIRSMLQASIS